MLTSAVITKMNGGWHLMKGIQQVKKKKTLRAVTG